MPVGFLSTALFPSPFPCKPTLPLLSPNHVNDFEYFCTFLQAHMFMYTCINIYIQIHIYKGFTS